MTSRLDRWLSRFPLDSRARRALLEAALDWRHEARAAASASERLRCHMKSIVAVARVLVRITREETFNIAHAVLLAKWLSLTVGIAGTLTVPWMIGPWDGLAFGHLAAFQLLSTMIISIPLATYLAALLVDDRRRPPALALTIWSVLLLALVSVGQRFAWTEYLRQVDGSVTSSGVSGSTVAWLAVFSGAMAMLADRVRLDRRRWLMSIVAPLAPWAVTISVGVAVGVVWQSLTGWIFPVTLVVTWFWLVRRHERSATVNQEPRPTG